MTHTVLGVKGTLVLDADGNFQELGEHGLVHLAMMSEAELQRHRREAKRRYPDHRQVPLRQFRRALALARNILAEKGIYVLEASP